MPRIRPRTIRLGSGSISRQRWAVFDLGGLVDNRSRTRQQDCRRTPIGKKAGVWSGTLALMILKTLQAKGPQHGYGLARQIEQTSGYCIELNYGTIHPALLKLERDGAIRSRWGFSANNRKAKFYGLTAVGGRQLRKATTEWAQTTETVARFVSSVEKK
jgi:PadR family transcriptional regulator, regulatory protein PadR